MGDATAPGGTHYPDLLSPLACAQKCKATSACSGIGFKFGDAANAGCFLYEGFIAVSSDSDSEVYEWTPCGK